MIINNIDNWLPEYRKDKTKIWTWIYLENEEYYAFNEYNDWFEVKSIVLSSNSIPSYVKLQYRSMTVTNDLKGFDGVYYIRSLLGKVGEDAIETLTLGNIKDDLVHKTVWIKEGLIERYRENSSLDKCFTEAILRWK